MILSTKSALDALWRMTLNAKEVIIRPRQAILGPRIGRSRQTLHSITFFFFFFIISDPKERLIPSNVPKVTFLTPSHDPKVTFLILSHDPKATFLTPSHDPKVTFLIPSHDPRVTFSIPSHDPKGNDPNPQ